MTPSSPSKLMASAILDLRLEEDAIKRLSRVKEPPS